MTSPPLLHDHSPSCGKVVRLHCRGDKYKLDHAVKPRAVADDLIYNSGNTFAIPIFSIDWGMGSSIHPEHIRSLPQRFP